MSFSESTGPPVAGDGVGAESLPDGGVRISVRADRVSVYHDLPSSVARSFAADILLVAAGADARRPVLAQAERAADKARQKVLKEGAA